MTEGLAEEAKAEQGDHKGTALISLFTFLKEK